MAIEVEVYERIRHLNEKEGKSQLETARILGIARNTVRKYWSGERVPWERQGRSGRRRFVVTDEVIFFVRTCLQEEASEGVKKRRPTAKRIYDQLVKEKGFRGGQSTIRSLVAVLKQENPLSSEPKKAKRVD